MQATYSTSVDTIIVNHGKHGNCSQHFLKCLQLQAEISVDMTVHCQEGVCQVRFSARKSRKSSGSHNNNIIVIVVVIHHYHFPPFFKYMYCLQTTLSLQTHCR